MTNRSAATPLSAAASGGAGAGSKNKAQSAALLLLSLRKFYAKGDHLERILPIINGKSDISLRLIDWFITNFSKKYNTTIVRVVSPAVSSPATSSQHVSRLNVFAAYRAQLKSYSKTHFDPFRRRDRIRFHYTKEDFIDTTIGQLNLFRWVLSNDILSYIKEHKPDIEEDMVASQRESLKKNRAGGGGSGGDASKPAAGAVTDAADDATDLSTETGGGTHVNVAPDPAKRATPAAAKRCVGERRQQPNSGTRGNTKRIEAGDDHITDDSPATASRRAVVAKSPGMIMSMCGGGNRMVLDFN